MRIGRGGFEAPEEGARRLVLDEREDLFELVDHEHELGAVRRQESKHGPMEPVLVPLS